MRENRNTTNKCAADLLGSMDKINGAEDADDNQTTINRSHERENHNTVAESQLAQQSQF